ncbi:MAG: hypothetical protein KF752_19265 [Pirellulaceae bacterium]|nr:hypothetical protein [Pirellulaceae bacterium]
MADGSAQALELLKSLDLRQEQVLSELDDLNLRIEKVIELYQAARGTGSSATTSNNMDIEQVDAGKQQANSPRRNPKRTAA